MADHKFPCLMFYLENQACADKFLRFLHENGIIPELIAEHQAGHSYAVATDDLDNALQRTASKPSANSVGRPRADVTADAIAHEYYEQGLSVSTIMERYSISRATVHRRLNETPPRAFTCANTAVSRMLRPESQEVLNPLAILRRLMRPGILQQLL